MNYFNHLSLLVFFVCTQAWAVPRVINFQANIRKPDSSRLESPDVSYRFKYLNSNGTCTLYVEDFNNISMVGSGGNISLKMGTGTKVFPPASVTLYETFNNDTANTFACSEGGSYAPLSSDEKRNLSIEFFYPGSGGLQNLNGIEINSVPYALHANEAEDAQKLGGYAAALYAKFSNFTTCTGGQVLTYNGTIFSCVSPGAAATFTGVLAGDVSGTQSATVVDMVGGKTAAQVSTSVDDTLAATSAATASRIVKRDGSGNAAFNTAQANNFSGRNLLLYEATNTNHIQVQAPATFAAGDYILTLPDSNGSPGQVLSTDGNGVTTWIPASTGSVTNVSAGAPLLSSGGATPNITMPAATAAVDGYLSAADFTLFNSKQAAGAYITALTGDVTAAGPGSAAATISANAITTSKINNLAVTDAKINDVAFGKITGKPTTLAGYGITDAVTNVTTGAPLVSSGGTTPNITMPAATAAVDGYLSAANFTTFNNKVSSQWTNNLADIYFSGGFVGIGTTTPTQALDVVGNIQINPGSQILSNGSSLLRESGASTYVGNGAIQTTNAGGAVSLFVYGNGGNVGVGTVTPSYKLDVAGDVNVTGNFKINGVNIASGTVSTVGATLPLLSSGGATPTISMPAATAAVDGYLTAANFTIFNNKQVAGNYITALTGDVTAAGPGSSVATIANLAVTDAKINDVAFSKITGKPTTLAGYGITDGVTNVSSANGDITITNPNSTPQLTLNSGVGPNQILKLDGAGKVPTAQIPNLDAAIITTGTLPIARGGTNATTANAALNNLLPTQTPHAGKVLQTDGTNTSWVAGNVGTVTNIATGTGLSGGPITGTGTISLANTAVTPATYGSASAVPNFTVDAQGRLTAAGSSAYQDATGAVKGVLSVGTNLQVAGGVISLQNASTTNTGALTNTDWNNFNNKVSSQWTNNAADIYFNTGNVGIGTSTPTRKLDVDGRANIESASAQVFNVVGKGTSYSSAVTGVATIYSENTTDSGGNVLKVSSAFNPTGFVVKDSGKVGIGIASPVYKLDVNGDVNIPTGSNFKINGVNIASGTVTNIATGTGLTGGPITGTGTISLASTAVTPGTYGSAAAVPSFTVDAQGRLTLAGSSAYQDATGVTKGILSVGTNLQVAGGVISLQNASTTNTGALTNTDWNTFNSKQPAGSYITALTGDVTAAGPGSSVATIANLAVTNAKINDVAFSKITGLPATLAAHGITDAVRNAGVGAGNVVTTIQSGNTAGRPAFGTDGRIYFDTQAGVIYRDSGAAWVTVASNTGSGGTVTGTGTTNKISKFTAAGAIGNSNIADDGTVVAISTDATINGVKVGLGGGAIATNTAVGSSALNVNTTGYFNTATGYRSMLNNTDGFYNTATGYQTLMSNTSGFQNTASGMQTLYSNTTGNYNTASGKEALFGNTIGNNNTAFGTYALVSNKAKSESTAIGFASMSNADNTTSTSVTYNTAVGAYSLDGSATPAANTGIRNTAIGHSSLRTISSGTNNTALGWNSGNLITTGSNNVVLGSNDGSTIATNSNNVIIADGAGNIRQQIDSSGRVGIGMAPATYMLNVNGDINIPTGSNFKINGVNVGLGTMTGTGTINTVPKFTAAGAIGNSNITDNGTVVTVATDMTANGVTVGRGLASVATNTALGYRPLYTNTTGNNNTAVGYSTLNLNTTGTNNVAVGANALYNNTTANYAVAIGDQALYSNTTGTANNAIGFQSMYTNTTGYSNTAYGYNTLRANTTGYGNVASGDRALNSNTVGTYNVGSGVFSLYTNTTGNFNTATGYQSLNGNTTGSRNSAFGYSAGSAITTGSYNVVIGSNDGSTIAALSNNIILADGQGNIRQQIDSSGRVGIGMAPATYMLQVNGDINIPTGSNFKINGTNIGTGTVTGTGTINTLSKFTAAGAIGNSNITDNGTVVAVSTDATINGIKVGRGNSNVLTNTALGANTLNANTTGTSGVAVGQQALSTNTTGDSNTAVGYQSLFLNTTGNYNVAMGMNSLRSNTGGHYNTGIGTQSLTNNTTGTWNTGVGATSLQANTTGANNTALGAQTLTANTTGNNNLAAGYAALNSNTTGSANAATGYYALNSNSTGDHNTANGHYALYTNSTGDYNTASGSLAMRNNTTGTDSVAMGYQALYSNTTGNYNIAMGSSALRTNTTGASNIATGYYALYSNTTGNSNVATGYYSLGTNTTGNNNAAYGSYSLQSNTTGNNNTSVGYQSLYSNTTGNDNTAIGYYSLRANSTGAQNTAVGQQSLYGNTTGFGNVATGYRTLATNTSGGSNSAFGSNAMEANTTGYANTAVGSSSMGSNTTGAVNTAIGADALKFNTTGQGNMAAGHAALSANTTGTANAAFGYYALTTNTTANYNTALGNESMRNNLTGHSNTATGHFSLGSNTTGAYNTITGYTAASYNTTGSNNVAVGYSALNYNKTKTESTAIGYNSMSYADDVVAAPVVTYNTAIGAYSFQGSATPANNTGVRNTALGHSALRNLSSGSGNVGVGYNSGSAITTGSNNVVIGSNTGSTIAATNNNILISDGAGNIRIQVDSAGQVGMGVAPTQALDVVGNIKASGCVYYSGGSVGVCASDERLKENVHAFDLGLETLMGINPVNFKYNGKAGLKFKGEQVGVIAQDLEKSAPSLVKRQMVQMNPEDKEKTEIKVVDYGAFTYVMINSIKDLYNKWFADSVAIHRELASVKEENLELKKKNEEIQKRLDRIEQMLNSK